MLPRICRECNCSFLGGPRAWYCPKCREERARKHDKEFKERKRAGKVLPLGSIIKCEICGNDMIKNSGAQRFCNECAEDHLKRIDNQQSLEWNRKHPEKCVNSKRKHSKQLYATGETFSSGVPGVSWDKGSRCWRSHIGYRGKQYFILRSKSKDIAILARKEAEQSPQINQDIIKKIRDKYKK